MGKKQKKKFEKKKSIMTASKNRFFKLSIRENLTDWFLDQYKKLMRRASIWINLIGRQTVGLKQAKNAFLFFFCFRPYVGEPDDCISRATFVSFASIYPTDPRTNL